MTFRFSYQEFSVQLRRGYLSLTGNIFLFLFYVITTEVSYTEIRGENQLLEYLYINDYLPDLSQIMNRKISEKIFGNASPVYEAVMTTDYFPSTPPDILSIYSFINILFIL